MCLLHKKGQYQRIKNYPHFLLHSKTVIYLTLLRKGLSHWRMQGWGSSQTLASLFHAAHCSSHTVSLRLSPDWCSHWGNNLTLLLLPCLPSRTDKEGDKKKNKQQTKTEENTHTHLGEFYVQWKGGFTY